MSESALLRATRDRIREHADFTDRQVNVELDERAPATAGDLYIIVTFGSVQPGPNHHPAGSVIDWVYGVNVSIVMRAPKKPRDRTRELWVETSASLQTHMDAVMSRVDFQYPLLADANAYILAEESSTFGFVEPLRFAGAGPIRQAPAEVFAGTGEPAAAVIRTLQFAGARRVQYLTQSA